MVQTPQDLLVYHAGNGRAVGMGRGFKPCFGQHRIMPRTALHTLGGVGSARHLQLMIMATLLPVAGAEVTMDVHMAVAQTQPTKTIGRIIMDMLYL